METKVPKVGEVETLLVLQQHRAKPHGSTEMKKFKPGDKYKQAGIDKLEVLGSGKCTRDLDAKVQNKRRKAPEKGEESFASPVDKLAAKIDQLIDLMTEKKGK